MSWKSLKTILVLDYQKRNNCKIFHSSAELIATDSDIIEALKSMHQSTVTKILKNMLVKIGFS